MNENRKSDSAGREGSDSSPIRKNNIYRKSFGAKTMNLLNLFVSHDDKMSFDQNVKHKERFSSVMQEMFMC